MKFASSAAITASVALVAASFVSAESTSDIEARTFGANQFWWKGGDCALTRGGPPKVEPCPTAWKQKEWKCPPGSWSFSSKLGFCIPHVEVEAKKDTPSCEKTHSWDRASRCCKKIVPKANVPAPPACKSNEFEFAFGSVKFCVPKGGEKNPPAPPANSNKDCKTVKGGWNWHAGKSCCVPHAPNPPAPTCVNGRWSDTQKCCQLTPRGPPSPPSTPPKNNTPPPPPPPSTPKLVCKPTEFKWTLPSGDVCLPRGGVKNPPSPPKGKDCSTTFGGRQWSHHGCCVPKTPDVPKVPICIKGRWDTTGRCCHSPPTPPATTPPPPQGSKAIGHKKRNHKSIRATLPLDGRVDPARCPKALTACPVVDGEYECLDPLVELTSCGGCASLGQGQNCMSIEGVESVTCEVGVCAVVSCRAGLAPSQDGKACI